jgi:hypothetical protein
MQEIIICFFNPTAIASFFHKFLRSRHLVIAIAHIAQAASGPGPLSIPSDLEPSEALIPGSEQTVRCQLRVIHRIKSNQLTKHKTSQNIESQKILRTCDVVRHCL